MNRLFSGINNCKKNVICAFSSNTSKKRTVYEAQLHELRKKWTDDYKLKQQIVKQSRQDEQDRLILESAKKLRMKREDAIKRKKITQENIDRANMNHRVLIAREKVFKEKDQLKSQLQFNNLVDDLAAESKYWVTKENMNTLICEKLFEVPATTGITTKSSELWRYSCVTTDVKRLLHEARLSGDFETLQTKLENIGQKEADTKEGVLNMFNDMIGTGADREKFDDLVESYTRTLENNASKAREDDNIDDWDDNDLDDDDSRGDLVDTTLKFDPSTARVTGEYNRLKYSQYENNEINLENILANVDEVVENSLDTSLPESGVEDDMTGDGSTIKIRSIEELLEDLLNIDENDEQGMKNMQNLIQQRLRIQ